MVFEVIRTLARRWYIVLIGFLLTTGLVFGAYKATPPEYNARALVLLLPPRADVGKGGNPLLLLSGLEQPAGILAAYFSSAPAQAEVEALSPEAEYEVGIDDSTRGPVIAVDVTDRSPSSALDTLNFLLERIPEELANLQEQVDTRGDAVVDSMTLTVDEKAEPDIRGTIRLMIAALVVGLVGTGFAAVAFDGFTQRRRQARESVDANPPQSTLDSNTSESDELQEVGTSGVNSITDSEAPTSDMSDVSDKAAIRSAADCAIIGQETPVPHESPQEARDASNEDADASGAGSR